MKRHFLRAMATFASLAFLCAGLPLPAQATLVGTDQVLHPADAGARVRIQQFLEREDVRQQLLARGVEPAQALARVAALTDREAADLARHVDQLPAGGSADILGVLLTVFVVLLITDILGLTKVFPFTRPIR